MARFTLTGCFLGLIATFALTATGCGSGLVAEQVRPDAPTAAEALGEHRTALCRGDIGYGEPLVVDLPSQARLDFELAMKDGIAVVRYSCNELELVKGCRLEGGYVFAGVSLKEDVIKLQSRDEIEANLPIGGASIAAGLDRGSSLQLALAMVGKQSTTVARATRSQLGGSCEGATHFVRAATVGAFALELSSDAKVHTAAEIFAAGLSGASTSKDGRRVRDGKVDACRAADPADEQPPSQCASTVRLELVPLSTEGVVKAEDVAPASTPVMDPCPEGFKLAAGKCTPHAEEAYLCAPSDKQDCLTQCERGNADSCFHAAMRDPAAAPQSASELEKTADLWRKACDGGSAKGCLAMGVANEFGMAGALPNIDEAAKLYEKSCGQGESEACATLASRLDPERRQAGWPEDATKSTRLYQRACDLGESNSCFRVANRYFRGIGTPKNPKRGVAVLERACDGGNAKRCAEAGMLLLGAIPGGEDMTSVHDPARGLALVSRSCTEMAYGNACRFLALMYGTGTLAPEVPASREKARHYFDLGCSKDETDADACDRLAKQCTACGG